MRNMKIWPSDGLRKLQAGDAAMSMFRISFLVLFMAIVYSVEAVEHDSWSSHFEYGPPSLLAAEKIWGEENLSFPRDQDAGQRILRVHLPKGSIDPGSAYKRGTPLGGAGFKLRVLQPGATAVTLSYRVRFAENFDFVRGGKLPGLFGGIGNSGGQIPNGRDGFSFRLMWGPNGMGTVYAYLPSSVKYGTNLLKGGFQFRPGKWHLIRQEVVLNEPLSADGQIRLWFDDHFIGEAGGLVVRTVDKLTIEGLLFDVFFGGNDVSWASTRDTHIDFSDIAITKRQP